MCVIRPGVALNMAAVGAVSIGSPSIGGLAVGLFGDYSLVFGVSGVVMVAGCLLIFLCDYTHNTLTDTATDTKTDTQTDAQTDSNLHNSTHRVESNEQSRITETSLDAAFMYGSTNQNEATKRLSDDNHS